MALHDMPNPHLVDQENCLSRGMKSQTKNTNTFSSNKTLDPLCHGRFPSRSDRLQFKKNLLYIKKQNISDGTPTKEELAIFRLQEQLMKET